MANPAATIPLTFDGVDIQHSDLGIFLEIVEGLNEPAQVRGVDIVVPGADGRVWRNRRVDVRRIVLAGLVRGNGATQDDRRANYRANVQTFKGLFDPTADPAVLAATVESDEVWTISARTLNHTWTEQVPSELAAVTVELESVDPEWVEGGS